MRFISFTVSIIGVSVDAAHVTPSESTAAVYSLTKWGCWDSEEIPECTRAKAKADLSSTLSTVAVAKKCLKYAAHSGCAAGITMTLNFNQAPVGPRTGPLGTLYGATIPNELRISRGEVAGLTETVKKLMLTPEASGEELMDFSNLRPTAGVYDAARLVVESPIPLFTSDLTPAIQADTDGSVSWTGSTENLPDSTDDLTIGVWVTAAQANTAKMTKFTPSVSIEYSLEKTYQAPPHVSGAVQQYEMQHFSCKTVPRGRKCTGMMYKPDRDYLNHKEAIKCMKYASDNNCLLMLVMMADLAQNAPNPITNATHILYAQTHLQQLRLKKEGLVGFKEAVRSFKLSAAGGARKMMGFNKVHPYGGTYHPETLFAPTPINMDDTSATVGSEAEWNVVWYNSHKDLSGVVGDITIGVLMTKAQGETAKMTPFLAEAHIGYHIGNSHSKYDD